MDGSQSPNIHVDKETEEEEKGEEEEEEEDVCVN